MRHPTLREIQGAVCAFYDISRAELLSPRRGARVVRARQVGMYLARSATVDSYPQIGRAFDRDHTTVMHAVWKVGLLASIDPELCAEVSFLQEKLLDEQAMGEIRRAA